jgi:hypothetical protein
LLKATPTPRMGSTGACSTWLQLRCSTPHEQGQIAPPHIPAAEQSTAAHPPQILRVFCKHCCRFRGLCGQVRGGVRRGGRSVAQRHGGAESRGCVLALTGTSGLGECLAVFCVSKHFPKCPKESCSEKYNLFPGGGFPVRLF